MIVVEPVPTHATGGADPGQLPGRRRLAHPRLPPRHRGLPRGRRRDDDPAAVPRRPARRRGQLLRPELVAVGPALVPRRRRQPRDDRGRDRGDPRRLRAGGGPGAAGRLRRRRAVRRVPRGHRPVLDAVVEPSHRRLGWLAREPCALLVHAAAPASARPAATTSSSAWPSSMDPGSAAALRRGAAGDRRLARRARADGLRHLRDRQLLRLLHDHADVAVPAPPGRAVRGGAQGRSTQPRRRAGREPHPHAAGRGGGARGGPRRPGVDRPRPDRRPPPGGQGQGRARRPGPAVHLLQPAVLGAPLPGLLDLVPDQPLGRAGARVGRRSLRAGCERPRTVLVVGGGPAGLEAARVAAERGHAVVLVEARDRLGGQWVLAGRQPTRSQILDHLAWYERELDRLGVDVRLGTPATAASVVEAAAEVVVLAAGARPADAGFQRAAPLVDRLPGIDAPTAASIHAVLEGDVVPHGRVLLLDDLGDWRGIGTAMLLQEAGGQVTLVTAAPAAAGGLFHSAADGPARRRFARAGGEVLPHHVLCSWAPGHAVLRSTLTGRRAHRRLRLARRRRDPRPPHRAGRCAHRGRHRPPRDRRLRGRPPRQPRHLRGSHARAVLVTPALPVGPAPARPATVLVSRLHLGGALR